MSSSISSSRSQVHGSQFVSSYPIITLDVVNSASMQPPAISASSPSKLSEARAISSITFALSYAFHPARIYCLETLWYSTASVFYTPTRRTPALISLDIFTLHRPHMVRTNSHSSQGLIIPKSAKRLARSAHLHEIKGSLSRRESRREWEMTAETCPPSFL
jgi:hypothetical protein